MSIIPDPFLNEIIYNYNFVKKDIKEYTDIDVNWENGETHQSKTFEEFFKNREITEENIYKFYAEQNGYILNVKNCCVNKLRDLSIIYWLANYTNQPKVLEFGGGPGNLAMLIKSYHFDIDYCDLGEIKKYAEWRFNKYNLLINTFNKPERMYDVIITTEVMEHLFDVEKEFNNLVSKINRGGYLLFTESCEATQVAEHLDKNYSYGGDNAIRMLEKMGMKFHSKTFWERAMCHENNKVNHFNLSPYRFVAMVKK